MRSEDAARKVLTQIEDARLAIAVIDNNEPDANITRKLRLCHTKLDEARLWLQDAIGYERKA